MHFRHLTKEDKIPVFILFRLQRECDIWIKIEPECCVGKPKAKGGLMHLTAEDENENT